MPRKVLLPLLLIAAAAVGAYFYVHRSARPSHFTGFVEGEERLVRSEVSGRVLEVRFVEGAKLAPDAVLAVLDARDIESRIAAKRQELAVIDAQLQSQEEKIALVESTWKRQLNAGEADVKQAEAAATLAQRTLVREDSLRRSGVTSQQSFDDNRARNDQAQSALERARQMYGRTEAEERQIEVARRDRETQRQQRELAEAQLKELEVTQSKYTIRAPSTETVVQTQFLWAGELAQPGGAVAALIDPKDKYVQIYVPVAELDRLRVGTKVDIELDSRPGVRTPGEVSFVADKASFTPEKIETRSDRIGQVYRAKVRILKDIETFQPGTEGNVFLVGDAS